MFNMFTSMTSTLSSMAVVLLVLTLSSYTVSVNANTPRSTHIRVNVPTTANTATLTADTGADTSVEPSQKKWPIVGKGFRLYCYGTCSITSLNKKDQNTPATPTTPTDGNPVPGPGNLLMGGHMYPGVQTSQDTEDYRWLLQRAGNSSTVVVLTADPIEDCNTYTEFIYKLGGASTVYTICFQSREGSKAELVREVASRADAFFFTGGDQGLYYSYWDNTPLLETIIELVQSGRGVFGGSSAGLAIQGHYVYTALGPDSAGDLTSAQALKNPYTPALTLTNNFFPFLYLETSITDTHFIQRDRMGRLVTFLARILTNTAWPPVNASYVIHGIGVSEHSALRVDDVTGLAELHGQGPIYLLSATTNNVIQCEKDVPLQMNGVHVEKWNATIPNACATFNMTSWSWITSDAQGTNPCMTAVGTSHYELSAKGGQLYSTQPGGSVY
eukprot:TRINITY_DN17957_c0_g1_i1.p1 TRINITY_DN17957_c0_g1~~TRINITY_DN17957_c0_g1_i1.p1  ORF type:complete len:443 (+),score=64.00 TRINITY_DN17957_c0_g1_i1:96-1424(+)